MRLLVGSPRWGPPPARLSARKSNLLWETQFAELRSPLLGAAQSARSSGVGNGALPAKDGIRGRKKGHFKKTCFNTKIKGRVRGSGRAAEARRPALVRAGRASRTRGLSGPSPAAGPSLLIPQSSSVKWGEESLPTLRRGCMNDPEGVDSPSPPWPTAPLSLAVPVHSWRLLPCLLFFPTPGSPPCPSVLRSPEHSFPDLGLSLLFVL